MSYNYPLDELEKLWANNPLIIPDTNVLLNLYRYSPDTTENILISLSSIESDIWLPHQVWLEYNRNRYGVIKREFYKYREVSKEVERIVLSSKNAYSKQFSKFTKFRFPKVNELEKKINELTDEIHAEAQKYKEYIKAEVKKNERMLEDDKIKEFFENIVIMGKSSGAYSISKLLDIYSEGALRYKHQIPPGYADEIEKDENDETKTKKYGDLIIWKQILEQAKISNRPIIFITNEEKKDWWILNQDEVPVKPRDELLVEFKEYSNQQFAMMSLTNFINHLSTINEITDHKTHLEMNATDICENFILESEWHTILDQDSQLTYYFIHSGELQEYVGNPLTDVEVLEASSYTIEINSVDIDANKVEMEGTFISEVNINISEAISGHHTETTSATVKIEGFIKLEFELDYNLSNETTQSSDDSIQIDLGEKDNFINKESLLWEIGGFEILDFDNYYSDDEMELCTDCGRNFASFFTSAGEPICSSCSANYYICPDCGMLFEMGTVRGAFCEKCEKEHD